MKKRVLMPLPDKDFDVTETAVPWRLLTNAGHEVVFATERGGSAPAADPLLLKGVIFGQLGAEPEPKSFYFQMEQSAEFRNPIAWNAIQPGDYDGLILPGGHASGMRQYLGSSLIQSKVSDIWQLNRPVGAICHGVLALSRAQDSRTGKSLLASKKTTCLPKYMELGAYVITAWKLGKYYRTYPAYVEDEVRVALDKPERQFERGPLTIIPGTMTDHRHAFVVEDGNYVSSRWWGDAYLFANKFLERL